MGLFGGNSDFHVNFGRIDLSYPDDVTIGDDFQVQADPHTKAGSDDYVIDEIQLYLETDDGTRYLTARELDAAVGGAIDRDHLSFRIPVDGDRVEDLAADGYVSSGERYQFRSHITFSDLNGGEQVEDYWDDDSGDGIRFEA